MDVDAVCHGLLPGAIPGEKALDEVAGVADGVVGVAFGNHHAGEFGRYLDVAPDECPDAPPVIRCGPLVAHRITGVTAWVRQQKNAPEAGVVREVGKREIDHQRALRIAGENPLLIRAAGAFLGQETTQANNASVDRLQLMPSPLLFRNAEEGVLQVAMKIAPDR